MHLQNGISCYMLAVTLCSNGICCCGGQDVTLSSSLRSIVSMLSLKGVYYVLTVGQQCSSRLPGCLVSWFISPSDEILESSGRRRAAIAAIALGKDGLSDAVVAVDIAFIGVGVVHVCRVDATARELC